jgi:hypothetical protein
MSIEKPFANNTLATFVYEPFSYTISNPASYTLTTSNVTSGITPGYIVNDGTEVIFSSPSNGMQVGTEIFTITAKSGDTVVAVSSNTVTIGAGRFIDLSGNGYVGSTFPFYKNEPITPIPLVAPFPISAPTSVPTLPPGLVYTSNASNIYSITGTPLVTVPQSNYLVIGKGLGDERSKIVTSQFGMSVSNERIVMNLTGSPIVSPMTIGTPIPQRVITAQYPPYPSGGSLRYSWFGLPDGITVTDISGNPQGPTTFNPSDPASTMLIQGTPTVAAANAYRNAGITSNVVTFTGTRLSPLPQLSNTIPLTFGFGETVLFDSVTVPPLYSGVALDPTAIFFRAQTYFGSGSGISNIFSPDLRSDLSLNFVAFEGRAYLTGTPGVTSSSSYTIRAINSNTISRDLSVPITVTTDSISFVSPTPNPVDASYNFVLSRPISAFIPGYYTSNVQFRAVAASGNAVTFSTSSLTGTGLSLSNVNSNTVQLVGVPETLTPLTTATITASAVGTPATTTTTFKFAILNDVITFSEPTALQLSFIQNRAITPIQLTATTLSERQVISFTSSSMPSGLAISTTGLITGTPLASTGSTFTVTASTGYMSQNKTYTYTLTADSIILIERPEPSYALTLGGPIPAATVSGLSYSGVQVSNFVFTSLPITYGMTIGNVTGVFGGTLTSSLEDPLLPSNVSFSVQATAGGLTASLPVELNTSNAPRYSWFILKGTAIGRTEDTLNNWSTITSSLLCNAFTDYSIRPLTVDTRSISAVTNFNEVVQSPDGTNFTVYEIPRTPWPFYDVSGAPMISNDTTLRLGPNVITRVLNTTTLYGAGYDDAFYNLGTYLTTFWKSTDDGVNWTVTFPVLASGLPPQRMWLSNGTSWGNTIAYKNGVLLIGGYNAGGSIIRSVDEGVTWAAATGADSWWAMDLNTDASRWIFAGSSYYSANTPWSGATDVRTLQYSDNQGATWSNVTSGDFNYIANLVVYGNGVWIAGGYEGIGDTLAYTEFRTSTDGLVWTSFTLPTTIYATTLVFYEAGDESRATLLDSILYDGYRFIIVIRQWTNNGSSDNFFEYAYSHLADGSSLSSGWTELYMPTIGNFMYDSQPLRLKGRLPVSTGVPAPILSFPSQTGNGPTVTSPTVSSILLYQYAAMTPITFSATGVGTIYFFVLDSDLPRGLTFNSVTNTLSGTPMLIGTESVTFYVKDDDGVTLFTLETRVIIPSIERQQTSAGAWTSLIRQYTVVNAAQNSLNGKTLPATEPPLGEFMRPHPPDIVNEVVCKKC